MSHRRALRPLSGTLLFAFWPALSFVIARSAKIFRRAARVYLEISFEVENGRFRG